ncbi:unnamed protein product [Toxocara canis]|uniref:dolichyl-P-Man:Man5GlcNAc2-PP-dolichol alpha-1,3-mannosyltransferase n=1 Tax=Toxocara canis TaxID=6265 RepID=A0A183VGN3_TOXCA|nr:unnamed protein product [Toxocara canis]
MSWRLGELLCFVFRVLIALPFLLYDPMSYLKRSFDLGRVFLFKWTVNWRLLPEHIFLDKRLHLALLIVHALLLMVFASKIWFRSHGGLILLLHKLSRGLRTRIGTDEVLMALFTANLLGISVARSLHYQFYSWYFHSLPYLLFSTVPFEVIPDTGVNVTANKLKYVHFESYIKIKLCLFLTKHSNFNNHITLYNVSMLNITLPLQLSI